MKILKYIVILIITFVCVSCNEHIRMDTMTITSEQTYRLIDKSDLSLYEIKYKTSNINNGLTIYVVAESNLFEVGDKVKFVKVEE